MSPKQSPTLLRRILGWLKPLLGLAILFWVAQKLPFSDQLELIPAAGSGLQLDAALDGEISGDWQGDRIRFRVGEESRAPAELPAEVRQRLAPGSELEIERGAAVEGLEGAVYSWKAGFPRVFRDLDPGGLVLGIACLLVALTMGTTRWWRLLAVAGCRTSFYNAFRLTFLGLFFNLVVPAGLTGGDLIKGVLVARENPGRRAEALVTVVIDRVLGLLVLVSVAAVVILISPAFAELKVPVLLVLSIGVGGAVIYWNQPLRRALHIEQLLGKLPMGEKLKRLDESAALYAHHPFEILLAVLLSLGNHFFSIVAVVFLGRAFGAEVPFLDYFAVVPVANIASAIPITPGGWGTGEFVYQHLFIMIGANPTLGVAISVTFRLCWMGLGLLGGIFLLLPGPKVDLDHLEEEARELEEDLVHHPHPAQGEPAASAEDERAG